MDPKKHEIWAVLLSMLSLLTLLSVISFEASDPTFFSSSSSGLPLKNWVGVFGANLAFALLYLLGIGAYFPPLLGFWISWSLFRGKRSSSPDYRLQAFGTCLALLSVIALLDLHRGRIQILCDQNITGGLLGEVVSSALRGRLSFAGANIFLLGTSLIAFLIATPFSIKTTVERFSKYCKASAQIIWKTAYGHKPKEAIQNPEQTKWDTGHEKSTVSSTHAPVKLELLPPPSVPVKGKTRKGSSSPSTSTTLYSLPPYELLDSIDFENHRPDWKKLEENAHTLEEKLADFGVQGKVTGILPGPVITMFEYAPAPGIKISRIVSLSDDLAMALKAISIRVVAPIPGKAAIGIEIPNQNREMVSIRAVLESEAFSSATAPLTIALGKDITGQPVAANLAKMPHLLIAGATGTGKSVCLNTILVSLLFRNTPEDLRLLLIDPKRIELKSYEKIPHLLHPVVTDAKMATRALRWAVQEMELRYRLLAQKNVRNIESYNRAIAKEKTRHENVENLPEDDELSIKHHHMPYMVIVIDELADLMMVASREVEESITRLAQMARAAGIHLILATQRPSVDVLTGIIKANIPTRISFQVSSRIDSRTILDGSGAESLLGSGDMLFLPPGTAKLQRIHGAFISEAELQRITDFWRDQHLVEDPIGSRVNFQDQTGSEEISEAELDDKYDEAVQLVLETRQASISMLQRRLRVGYNRAARMIELMEQQGIVGPSDGVKPREVLGKRP